MIVTCEIIIRIYNNWRAVSCVHFARVRRSFIRRVKNISYGIVSLLEYYLLWMNVQLFDKYLSGSIVKDRNGICSYMNNEIYENNK